MAGGLLIHDETKLQGDLIMKMKNGIPKLVGWADCGEDATNMRIKEGDDTKSRLRCIADLFHWAYWVSMTNMPLFNNWFDSIRAVHYNLENDF